MDPKTYLAKVGQSAQKLRNKHLSRPSGPFWGFLAAILDFAGSAVLRTVSECPRRRFAGIFKVVTKFVIKFQLHNFYLYCNFLADSISLKSLFALLNLEKHKLFS